MYNENCEPVVRNCKFTGNYASVGGGTANYGGGRPVVEGRNSRLGPSSLSGFTKGYAETSEATPGQVAGELRGSGPSPLLLGQGESSRG